MEETYDFSKGVCNPYAERLKKQVTLGLEHTTVDYFQGLSQELGIPYQALINCI